MGVKFIHTETLEAFSTAQNILEIKKDGGGVGILVQGRCGVGPPWRCTKWVRREVDGWERRECNNGGKVSHGPGLDLHQMGVSRDRKLVAAWVL